MQFKINRLSIFFRYLMLWHIQQLHLVHPHMLHQLLILVYSFSTNNCLTTSKRYYKQTRVIFCTCLFFISKLNLFGFETIVLFPICLSRHEVTQECNDSSMIKSVTSRTVLSVVVQSRNARLMPVWMQHPVQTHRYSALRGTTFVADFNCHVFNIFNTWNIALNTHAYLHPIQTRSRLSTSFPQCLLHGITSLDTRD